MRKVMRFLLLVCGLYVTGCATVQLHGPKETAYAKQFKLPEKDKSGLYIYREGILGSAIKKDIWVNGKCVGESAPNVFFYYEVTGDSEHTISTESEFSYNELKIKVIGGRNYFVEQYIKMGLFVGGADLILVEPEVAKKIIMDLDMAVGGKCSSETPQ